MTRISSALNSDEKYELPEWVAVHDSGGIFFVNTANINLEDFMQSAPGRIVRCDAPPSEFITYIPPQLAFERFGFIAGMVSDAA